MTTETQNIVVLEIVENGSQQSAVDDTGKIWATERGSKAMLRALGFAARRGGYEAVMIGSQSWDVAVLCAM